ncbi:MAG TPA: MFS transporter [Bacillota bacterium]|nr:MFS transporter [Peptococcaceae bacterium]HPZ42671.1 MFS transporter [Bacillota bacterium]HQD75685.1 MFS transporter [Bacillota bacterium]HUM57955.1 MFS transporter [Bacillota bacterium]
MHSLKRVLSSRKDFSLLLILFLMEFTRGAFYLTFLPLYAVKYLGLSVAVSGLAISAHYFVETLFKGAAGWQLDRRGHRILNISFSLGLATLLLMKMFPTAAVLVIGSAVFGLSVTPVWLAVVSGVAPVQLKDRASRMGIVFAVWLTGAGGGPVVISFFIENNYNLAFWFLIALWGLALIVSATMPGKGADRAGGSPGFSLFKEVARMAGNPSVKYILLPGMFLQTLAGGLILPLLPLYAQDVIGFSPRQYAFLLIAGGAAAVLCFLPMGHLADRFRLRYLLATGFGLTALSLAMFSTARAALSAYLLAALVGFSYAVVLPAWNNLLAKSISPEHQATGWGLFATVEGMGIAVGPALGGAVTKSFGLTSSIIVSTVLLAVMACFYFLYPVEKFFFRQI